MNWNRFSCLSFVLALGMSFPVLRGTAQALPAKVLELPLAPVLLASAHQKPRAAPSGGGVASGLTLISQLTLPEKPAADPVPAVPSPPTAEEVSPAAPESPAPAAEGEGDPPAPLLPAESDPAGLLPPADDSGLPPLPTDPPAEGNPPGGDPLMPEDFTDLPVPDVRPVPGTDLAPLPQPAQETETPGAVRGPIFRVRGSEAVSVARAKGFRFTPAQGLGRRDGWHTAAAQVPNVLTSEVHGARMMQMRPSLLWTTPYIENTFYMFCDSGYNAVRLAPGWKIRGIRLKGPDWHWVACPRSGANTASFSIRIRSWKVPDAPPQGSVVILEGLTLEGPQGASDWKAAFPDLNRRALRR